jgi:hypothetical protein
MKSVELFEQFVVFQIPDTNWNNFFPGIFNIFLCHLACCH